MSNTGSKKETALLSDNSSLWRIPFSVHPQMVNEMLSGHVIEESSRPWTSSVVLIEKKSRDLWVCFDYRRSNALTSKDVFLVPQINNILDQLSRKCIFLTLDKVHESSHEKTAFVTMDGNAPTTFQSLSKSTWTLSLRFSAD